MIAVPPERRLPRRLRCAAFTAMALAAGWLVEGLWIGWAVHRGAAVDATRAAMLVLAMDGGEAFVLWSLRAWLTQRFAFHGADRYVLLVIAILLSDIVPELYIITSHAPGFQVYTYGGPYTLILAYPIFEHIAIAVARIALGYSLLRFPDDPHGALAWYAYAQIAIGTAFASMTLGMLAIIPGAAGNALLGVFLLRVANDATPSPRVAVGEVRPAARKGVTAGCP